MQPSEDHAPEGPIGTEEDEVLAAFRDAGAGLTDCGMFAVVTIRRERSLLSSLEELLLEGKIDAHLLPGVSSDTLLHVKDFVFYAVSEEKQQVQDETCPSEGEE